ncbi:AraC family transcriptional regulator [Aestuariicoccus sp. MJ-SS9]|uniref:helix-turn-helix transcriptional regulator n=1 Tax=Aestuariicoccus sp. MJ-SS9 TaxID=3079855 RepID=UPI00290B18F9|nr:AraC family transcriptional regulator [Aestuariicoccus sp. MJ-SS9]MDU8913032.1 AraC family transcriptional regulator [Aestuariicoccus sp. MJ-SS9]
MTAGLAPIRSMTYARMVQGQGWRTGLLHDRPDNVLIWITRGQGRVVINGIRRGMGTHNALWLPAGRLWSIDPGPQSLAQVVISPAGLTGRLPKEPLHLRVRDSLGQAELTGHIEAMQREMSQNRPLLQEALEAHVRLIAVWLWRQQAAGAADAPEDTAGHRLVRRFVRDVVAGPPGDRPVAAYAAALEVTPTHLTRACRAACGKSANQILTERRLHAAQVLLGQPTPPIQNVARHLGFHSPAYFTRFIRSHTGKAPSVLRRALRQAAPE